MMKSTVLDLNGKSVAYAPFPSCPFAKLPGIAQRCRKQTDRTLDT